MFVFICLILYLSIKMIESANKFMRGISSFNNVIFLKWNQSKLVIKSPSIHLKDMDYRPDSHGKEK